MDQFSLLRHACTVLLLLLSPMVAANTDKVAQPLDLINAPLSVPLIANQGQVDPQVAYYADTFGGRIFVTREGELVYALSSGSDRPVLALRERFVGAAQPKLRSGAAARAKISRFSGHYRAEAAAPLQAFQNVELNRLYPGISLQLAARGRSLEKLFLLAPNADPEQISVTIDGAEALSVAADGQLALGTAMGPVAFTAPIAWQTIDGERRDVAVAYRIDRSDPKQHRYGFALGDYDRSQPLTIDPLLAATNLGGPDGSASTELINSLLLADGALYVAGNASASDFPTTAGVVFPTRPVGSFPGYIARLSTDLSTLESATYLAGHVRDPKIRARSGSIYFAAGTLDPAFPTTAGAFDTSFNGGTLGDMAIAQLSLDLTQLQAGTFLGGSSNEVFFDVETYSGVTDSMICVVGDTQSSNYPTTPGAFDTTINGSNLDAVISCLSLGLTQLKGSTFYGTTGIESAVGLAMMPDGVLFRGIAVVGTSGSTNLPAMTGFQTSGLGGTDSFVITFSDSSLSTISAGTYLGGSDVDRVENVVYSTSLGALYVVGRTRSLSGLGKYPVTIGAYQINGAAEWDIFASRLPRSLASLQASTLLGGNGIDEVSGITLSNDALVILGLTTSDDLPTVAARAYAEAPIGAISTSMGRFEAYIAQLSPGLSALHYGSYYGVYQTSIFQGSTVSENRPQESVSVFDRVPALDLARDSASGDIFFPFLNANATLSGFQSNLNNPGIVRMNLLGQVAELQVAPAFVIVSEGAGSVTLTTSRGGSLAGFSRAVLARQSGGAAQSGSDFLAPGLPSIRSWQPGADTMQQVTIEIVDDDVQEAPNESAFFGYNMDILGANLASTSFQTEIVIQDDDQAGIAVDSAILTPAEGETVPLGIRLTSSPPPGSESVNVRITSSDTSVATIEGADALGIRTLSFSASNWNQFQFAQIVADDNAVVDGNRSFQIQFLAVLHSDPFINGITHTLVPGTVFDDDTAGVDSRFSATQTTSEDDAGMAVEIAQLRLTSEPAAPVSLAISLSPEAAGEGSPNTTALQFNAGNWSQFQSVLVNPLDDAVADGNRTYTLSRTLSSSDSNYQQPTPSVFVEVTNLDNEMAQIDLAASLSSGQPQGFVPPSVVFSGTTLTVTNNAGLDVENVALSMSANNALVTQWICAPAAGSGAATLCQTVSGSGAFSALQVDLGAGDSVIIAADIQPTGPLGSILTVTAGALTPPGVADPDLSNNQRSYTLSIANSADIFADGFESP